MKMLMLQEIIAWPEEKKQEILEKMNRLLPQDIERINQEVKEVQNSEVELGILTKPHFNPNDYIKEISIYCYFLLNYDKK